MSFLKLNRLVVTKDGKDVYSEEFHSGVNIIRGVNSAGKSTVANLIFYAIGGEFINWLPEAASCDSVLAELEINDNVITVRRDIETIQRRPMMIYFGPLSRASQSLYEGWISHPYNRTDNTESFSQVLFKMLGFPEVSTENQDSITMNQILRLIYIDQLSSLESLMRNEDFDSPVIRSAIGNLLLGMYDDDLLSKQMVLRSKEREFNEIQKQVTAIEDVFKNSPFEFNKTVIDREIGQTRDQLIKVLATLKEPALIADSLKKTDTRNQINLLAESLVSLKKKYGQIQDQIKKIQLEVIDSKEFISVLVTKLSSIKDSIKARTVLGNLPILYCPVCLEKISEETPADHCALCKTEVKDYQGSSKVLRMQLEIEMQIKESSEILQEKDDELKKLTDDRLSIEKSLQRAQSDYDIFINQSRSSLENKYDALLEQKGKLIAQLDFLDKQLKLIYSYEEYKIQSFALKNQIEQLNSDITRLKDLQRSKTTTAYNRIKHYALELLSGDGKYEEKFQNGQAVSIDFSKNSYYLDGRNRFSASSMVLLKNCVRFAIFFASVELEYFRFPRFILCDNMEDKGMVPARSQNFQINVVKIAQSEQFKNKKFQIIYSTSMIPDSLNAPEFTVGEFYTEENKTLKI